MVKKYLWDCLESGATLIERNRCIEAVDAEPELPGDIPPELVLEIFNAAKKWDVDFLGELLRSIVRTTKGGIRERIANDD